jgi:hypothetical protein
MKNYIFIAINIVGFFFAYCALDVLVYWLFHEELYFPSEIQKSVFIPIGIIFLLPIISFANIKFANRPKIDRILALIYIILWLIVLIRFIILFN